MVFQSKHCAEGDLLHISLVLLKRGSLILDTSEYISNLLLVPS